MVSVVTLRSRVFSAGLIWMLPVLVLSCTNPTVPDARRAFVLFDEHLQPGIDVGVDTSDRKRDWAEVSDGVLRLSYPPGQNWGAVFLTTGLVADSHRACLDFSRFKTLELVLRGGHSGILLFLKDSNDPDNGTETKAWCPGGREWRTVHVPLTTFANADLRCLYVVTGFTFSGPAPDTVECRCIRMLPWIPQED